MNQTDKGEEIAYTHFAQKFVLRNGKNRVTFERCVLREAIRKSLSSQKLLILYLHNDFDKFSKVVCSSFIHSKINPILTKSYNLLCWDLSTNVNGVLENVVEEWDELKLAKEWITNQKSAVFIIFPLHESFLVYGILHGDAISINHIFKQLTEAKKTLQDNLANKNERKELESDVIEDKIENQITEKTTSSTTSINIQKMARLCFAQKFSHLANHVKFQDCCLDETINLSLQTQKLLILYFHNDNDAFSKIVCKSFTDSEIKRILAESYNILCWDLSANTKGILEDVVGKRAELETAKQWISVQKSAFFIILPFKESFVVYRILYGNGILLNDICSQLKDAIKTYQDSLVIESELQQIENTRRNGNDIGLKEFQQMMCDRLGDRDFDSFEPNEHNFLKDKIGFAKFGPPQDESGYDENQKKSIDETYSILVTHNNMYSKWKDRIVVAFIYNCIEPLPEEKLQRSLQTENYDPYTDIMPIPIFVIRKCKKSQNSCRIFVDCNNRVYSSWTDYINNNKLHKCMMILPKNGRYFADEYGNVKLEKHASPSCSIQYNILQNVDVASGVAGIASGAVFLGAAAIPVAPIALSIASVTGIGVGLYSIFRSGMKLYDRAIHCETLHIQNSEARGAYLNIVAGSLGFVGAGATTMMSQFAAEGVHIGEGARAALNFLNLGNASLNAAALANATYELYDNWKEGGTISTLSIIQLGSSVLFFGNAVYNFRTADTIINDAQTNALRSHQEALRSNRHRKTFNKMVKETIRQNNGDVQAGRAEVISTISKISNRDEVLAVLTRNNRMFNRENVRFAVKDGQITLNGVVVDLMQMGALSKAQRTQILIDLPPQPKPSLANIRSSLNLTRNIFNNVFMKSDWTSLIKDYFQDNGILETISVIMIGYSEDVKEKIFEILKNLLQELNKKDVLKACETNFKDNVFVVCLNFIIQFLKLKMNEFEKVFSDNPKKYFSQLNDFDADERAMIWFKKAINSFFNNQTIDRALVNELEIFAINEIASKMYINCNKERLKEMRTNRSTNRTTCSICRGHYYTN